ncbi:MAG: hypothetical protein H7X71_02575 [Chitinophagales bacterium]|nr:hypothetical protein [Chitinophagales bacterium]
MKNIPFISALFTPALIIIILSGCSRIYYAPTTQNVPLLTEQNELRIAAGISGGEEYEAVNIEVAYSPVKYVGIMLNSFHAAENSDSLFTNPVRYKGNLTEAGIGFYYPLATYYTAEVYAGYGKGTAQYPWSFDTIAPLKFDRFFVQFSAGMKRKYFEIALSDRFSYVHYTNIEEMYKIEAFSNYKYVPKNNQLYIFQEPALTMRAGLEAIKFQMQYQICIPFSGPTLGYSSYNFNLGIMLTPSVFFK